MAVDVASNAAKRRRARPKTVHRPRRSLPQEAMLEIGRRGTRGWGMATAGMRPPPDFLLIGTKRGGTTSAYFHLLSHPDVLPLFPSARLIPKGRDSKGAHFFDTEYVRGARWYAAHFPSRARRWVAERASGRAPVAGEASPYYLYHPLAAERAHALVPGAKLLIALRDPVERTYSHFREQRRNRVETLDFEAALAQEDARTAGEEERIRADPTHLSFAHEHQSFAGQSEYARPLARWLRRYPRERIHVWASEDYYADPNATVRGICEFLGLAGRDLPRLAPMNPAPPAPMAPAVRARLVTRFAPDVAEVERLLGRSMPWPAFH